MKRPLFFIAILLALAALAAPFAHGWFLEKDKGPSVRPPMVAGQFYPADSAQLRAMADGFLVQARPTPPPGLIYALIAPHAGYAFSGHIAAQSFALLKGKRYKRVVVLAPSHHEFFSYASVFGKDAYATPLGEIPIDKEFAEKLTKAGSLVRFSDKGHADAEHAVEVELPFLQRTLGYFKLVPIIVGEPSYDIERALSVALAQNIKTDEETGEPDTLIVASSDLSHYHPYDRAVSLDRRVLDAITDGDYFSLSTNIAGRVWEACGGGPIVAAMIAAERLGANARAIIAYANSGDVTDDRSRVVGYGAAVFYKQPASSKQPKNKDLTLSLEDKETLLAIAKSSIETAVKRNELPPLPANLPPALQTARGAFVTLKKNGELRGCIGMITPIRALAETVRAMAAAAALEDSRFSPVREKELPQLDIEISVLSPLRRVSNTQDIQVGRDGLVIRKGDKQGLLLPQVPVEQSWDRETFMEQTAIKAGLPPWSWKAPDTDLFAFHAAVFKKERDK